MDLAYVPAPNFHGNDSFTYQAYDGLNNSAVTGVVTLNDSSAGTLFFDSFARSHQPRANLTLGPPHQ